MTTAIIGLGRIGSPLAQEFVTGGETVVLASRKRPTATVLANRLGPLATAATVAKAISSADVVIFAIAFDLIKEMVAQFGDLLNGKIVVDPSNPVTMDENKKLKRILPEGRSAGSVIAGLLPAGTRFVKAFGTLSAESLGAEAGRVPNPAVLFYATDDADAGEVIERLIRSAGFDPVKVGGVQDCLRIEVGGELHQFGGLNGKVLGVAEARAAQTAENAANVA
jgi:predicted dinucleotide-binding enzyme